MVLGALLWYIYCVRLNGILLVVTVFIAFLRTYAKKPKEMASNVLFVFSSFAALYLVFNLLIFPKPSSLSNAMENMSIPWIKEGLTRQFYELSYWYHYIVQISTQSVFSIISKLSLLTGSYEFSMGVSTALIKLSLLCVYLLMALSLVGMAYELKKYPHLVFFVLVSFIGTSAVNLVQGMRYLYPILPFILIFTAAGLKAVFKAVKLLRAKSGGKGKRSSAFWQKLGTAVLALYVLAVLFTASKPIVQADIQNVLYPQRDEKRPTRKLRWICTPIYRKISRRTQLLPFSSPVRFI